MFRRLFCKLLLVAVVVFGLLALSVAVMAQGRSADAFERVKEVQELHTDRLMALTGVEGTAIGLDENGRLAIAVFTAGPAVPGIPRNLEGVPVKVVVSGKIYALKPPTNRPPKAPRVLTATAISESEIDLDWKDNREPGVTYNVYCATSSGGYNLANPLAKDLSSSNYSNSGLATGTTYYYVVTAENDFGESGYSNEASSTTEGGVVHPPVAPSNLNANAVSSSQIDLIWDDNSDNETGFSIERLIETSYVEIATVGAGENTYSNTGLEPLTKYTYRVCAYNSEGDSDYSNTASDTTNQPPEKPQLWCERPVPIGVSTGHPDITAGTIGCRVKDIFGNVYALSNNHVYADENRASIGDNVLQPGAYDGGVDPDDAIGTLAGYVDIIFHPRAYNEIDAAIALSSTDDLGNATPDDVGYGTPSTETVFADLGMAVQKYGRTTGLTSGVVTYVNVAVKVGYDSGTARFVNQIVISPGTFSDGGDSGSLVVTGDSNCKPVGLLFAGSSSYTIANPINEVLTQLRVTIDGKSNRHRKNL
ncbi:MAG TPA: hypothetical protein DIU00_11815 [Phycisphaerales bacterium]|nr:hypothetical protein [Phycisphaerales bacterium]